MKAPVQLRHKLLLSASLALSASGWVIAWPATGAWVLAMPLLALACCAALWPAGAQGPGSATFHDGLDGGATALDVGSDVATVPGADLGVQALRADLARQTAQVAHLQRQAQRDPMTGLALRHHFLDRLQEGLVAPHGRQAALLLVRVADLEVLNQRVGHAAADSLLCAAAQVLLTYTDRIPGALAGRLNGSDFALYLPAQGVAQETAQALRATLLSLPSARSAGAVIVVGGVDGLPQTRSGTALSEADAALARAEAGEGEGVAVDAHGDLVADIAGARAWRAQIAAALAEGRARLDEVPVHDASGQVLHRGCSLQLQLAAGAAYQPAKAWQALARRGQLQALVDEQAVALALRASAQDGHARALRVAASTLMLPAFAATVSDLLRTAPAAARRLLIEIDDAEGQADLQALAPLVSAWRALGVRWGVLHTLSSPQQLPAWRSLGVSHVTVGAQHVRGLAGDAALRTGTHSLFSLIRSLGLVVLAEPVLDSRERALLWSLGLQGMVDDRALQAVPAVQPAQLQDQPTSPVCSV